MNNRQCYTLGKAIHHYFTTSHMRGVVCLCGESLWCDTYSKPTDPRDAELTALREKLRLAEEREIVLEDRLAERDARIAEAVQALREQGPFWEFSLAQMRIKTADRLEGK